MQPLYQTWVSIRGHATRFGILAAAFVVFGTRGHAQSPAPDDFAPQLNDSVWATAVQTDGKVLIGGQFTGIGLWLARLNPDGSLDHGFDAMIGPVGAVALQPDGKLVVGAQMGLARFNPDASRDIDFNPQLSGSQREVNALALQADGGIVIAGRFLGVSGQTRRYLARLHPDGTLDTGFSPDPGGRTPYVNSMALQPDGKILLGGYFTEMNEQPRSFIARLHADGTLDTAFDVDLNNTVDSLALQPDGKILIGGNFTRVNGETRSHLARLDPDGTLDDEFNPAPGGNFTSIFTLVAIALQADGKVLVGGQFTTIDGQARRLVARLNPDGTPDDQFDSGATGGPSAYVGSLAVQGDGRILVGGYFDALGEQPRSNIGRLGATGPATQSLTHEGSTLTWLRGGTGPEVWRTTFEISTDRTHWSLLGAGTRIAGGWQRTDVWLPPGGTVRARGFVCGGYQTASSWFVEAYGGTPILTVQPSSCTNCVGTTAAFRVGVEGSSPLSFQWLKNGTALADDGRIGGTTTTELRIAGVVVGDAGSYSVLVSNIFGAVTSAPATLTVIEAPPACHPIANTPQAEFALCSAFDGLNFLVGIRGDSTSPNAVGAQLMSPAGDRIGALIRTGRLADGEIAAPYVAFGSSRYLMTWTDTGDLGSAQGNDVYAQFVTPEGTLVGGPFPIAAGPGDQEAAGVAFDGAGFLVVWSDAGTVKARRVSPEGQWLGSVLAVASSPTEGQVGIAYGGGHYLVAWVEGPDGSYTTRCRLVSPAGAMGGILTLSQTPSDRYNPTSVAYGGDRFLVVWHHAAFIGADWDLRGRFVTPNGAADGGELSLAAGPNDALAIANSVVFDGQDFVLVWTDWVGEIASGGGTILGRCWSVSGTPVGEAFTIDATTARPLAVGLSAGGGTVLVAVVTDLFSPAADVCARFVTRPCVRIRRVGSDRVEVSYQGRIQTSTDLETWTDEAPQPANPWPQAIGPGSRFYRAVSPGSGCLRGSPQRPS